MNLLIDTHVFLWLMSEPEKVTDAVAEACRAEDNELYLSAASLWEIQIKSQLGKLETGVPLGQLVSEQIESGVFRLLEISHRHILALDQLPLHHRDPFDRILLAQAMHEEMRLATADAAMGEYSSQVRLLW